MVVLDATIVNIALPSAQQALHFSTDNRQWIVTAYALAFGSLLLVGGKLGDLFGRKWTLIGGLVGFSIASAIGGLAQSFGMLVAARALQGAFGALLAPSALGAADRDVPRLPGPAQGVRDLQRDRGGRRLGRAAARRRPDPGDLLALEPVRQPRDRGARGDRGAATAQQRASGPIARGSTSLAWRWPRVGCSPWSTASPTPRPTRGRPGHDLRAGRERRAAERPSCCSSGGSRIRCCRCTSSWTERGAARTRRSPSPARPSSRSSCS